MGIVGSGCVIKDDRVGGVIIPSRTLVDEDLKRRFKGGLGSAAEVNAFELVPYQDQWLILGSDGLWDFFAPTKVMKFAAQRKKPQKAADELVHHVKKVRGGTDDCTVLTVRLYA